ncbi:MAG: DUF58 domain-containing protein [Chloroflexi bacterium]|nr:DUF58 domain-containing protein [Chloroflexota bacterium]
MQPGGDPGRLEVRLLPVGAAVLVAAAAFIIGFATGFWLLFRVAYVVAFALPLLYLWTRSMGNALDVEVTRRTQRVTQGLPLTGRLELRSSSFWPKVWLEVEDPCSIPGHLTRRVLTLGPRELKAWQYSTPTRRRGVYELGPVSVTAVDPLGLFRLTRRFGRQDTVLVYPSAPELPNFYIPPANLPGEGRFRQRTHNVTPTVAGVREYAPGDSYNRIHWPATARTGELMVKQFELDPSSDIWIVLDLEQAVHIGEDDDSSEETAVSICASIARYFLGTNRSVGFVSFGERLHVQEPDRGQNHYTRILESLAMARAAGDVPLSALLLEEARRFGRHTTVVVVTPSTDASWALALMSLAARGVPVAAVLLEAETFSTTGGDGDGSSLDVYGTLAAGGIYTYTVKRRDDLVRALSTGREAGVTARPAEGPR